MAKIQRSTVTRNSPWVRTAGWIGTNNSDTVQRWDDWPSGGIDESGGWPSTSLRLRSQPSILDTLDRSEAMFTWLGQYVVIKGFTVPLLR